MHSVNCCIDLRFVLVDTLHVLPSYITCDIVDITSYYATNFTAFAHILVSYMNCNYHIVAHIVFYRINTGTQTEYYNQAKIICERCEENVPGLSDLWSGGLSQCSESLCSKNVCLLISWNVLQVMFTNCYCSETFMKDNKLKNILIAF